MEQLRSKLTCRNWAIFSLTMWLIVPTLCFSSQTDGERTVVYSRALDTLLNEYCTVYRSGNSKCQIVASSNLASIQCTILTQFNRSAVEPSLDAYTVTEEPFYNGKLREENTSPPADSDQSVSASTLGKLLLERQYTPTIVEHPMYTLDKLQGRHLYKTMVSLDDTRAIELSVIISRVSTSYAMTLKQFAIHNGDIVQSNPLSCSRQWVGNGEFDRFDRLSDELEAGLNLLSIDDRQ